MKTTSPRADYDIVVIGGGLVGASFACVLNALFSEQPLSILVVEAVAPSTGAGGRYEGRSTEQENNHSDFDARTTALSAGSSEIYQRAGIWAGLSDRVTPIKQIHVSDRGHFGSTWLNNGQWNADALGYVVENHVLAAVLNAAMDQAAHIELLCPATVDTIRPRQDGMNLHLNCKGGQFEVSAGLVVLADGGKSPICRQLGIVSRKKHYQQQAIISTIAVEKTHENVAYERFTDTGPMAVLPLAPQNGLNRAALIWTVTDTEADTAMQLEGESLLPLIQERFGHRLGRILKIGKRYCYPLSLSVATEQVRPGLVLLGNVAHTLHPVAGQGLNLALRDVESLVLTLLSARQRGLPMGSMQALQEFMERQRRDQLTTIGFTHYLTRLFSSNKPALVWARKFGLFSIDLVPVVRRRFARQAMGFVDR
ncbi:MAG: 2-octaprenyl-6-methoxyphenyl hydroxylase [Pseudohongiellaceae bacterium]